MLSVAGPVPLVLARPRPLLTHGRPLIMLDHFTILLRPPSLPPSLATLAYICSRLVLITGANANYTTNAAVVVIANCHCYCLHFHNNPRFLQIVSKFLFGRGRKSRESDASLARSLSALIVIITLPSCCNLGPRIHFCQ